MIIDLPIRLREMRELFGLSQVQLAKKMPKGYSQGYLSRIESGHIPLTVKFLNAWSEGMGLDVQVVFKRKGRRK